MKHIKSANILAKDLEIQLKLNKSTISYNLKILERSEFINRKTPIEQGSRSSFDEELDQRQKFISINDNGKNFLIALHNYLANVF